MQKWNPAALEDARTMNGLTRHALALRCGVPWHVINQYELGNTTPSVKRVCTLADALGVPVAHFFTGNPDADV